MTFLSLLAFDQSSHHHDSSPLQIHFPRSVEALSVELLHNKRDCKGEREEGEISRPGERVRWELFKKENLRSGVLQ